MSRLLFNNGRVVHAYGIRRENILIDGEKIVTVGESVNANPADRIIDCTGKLIFPGIIDAHTHMGIPIKGGWSADDFASGSRVALHGGVTTIIDFTILEQGQSLRDSIVARRQRAERSLCDVHLHCNFTRYADELLSEIPEIIKDGITSFKVFTTYKEAGMMLPYEEIRDVARILANYGGLLMVHAEDNGSIESASQPLIRAGQTKPEYHGLSRPDTAEAKAVEQIGNIADETGVTAYIVHLSSKAGLEAGMTYKNLILETCPQYLFLTDATYQREDGRMFVASPPLRSSRDNQALFEAVLDGRIAVIGTDHCPFNLKDKPVNIPFQDIPNGMGGVETLFPVMLAHILEKDLDLSILTRTMCTNPAKIFGLYPQKGQIAEDADADMVIVDPEKITTNWVSDFLDSGRWTAFGEFPALFPEKVYRRGQLMVETGTFSSHARGRFIKAGKHTLINI